MYIDSLKQDISFKKKKTQIAKFYEPHLKWFVEHHVKD